ncbi:MAG: P-loop NTPase [Alphaproteobacteria bacterium]
MAKINKDTVIDVLRGVHDPKEGRDVVSLEMVGSVQITQNNEVIVVLDVDPARGVELESLRQEAERRLVQTSGVKKASVILTASKQPSTKGAGQGRKHDPHGMGGNPPVEVPARHIIVVASGKGGVGKSTVSANIAVSLAQRGLRVGLLDADIYGPSQPVLMGDEAYKPDLTKDKKLIPLQRHGIQMMSIGFMVEREKALIWRGPMAQSAFYQLLRDVAWGDNDAPLDFLVVDMPPGTGDIQLTLAQKVKVSGAVIVSTPQDIALIDARRGVSMFEKTDIPVLGLIENMSTYICSQCGHEDHIFGHGGAQKEAEKVNVPFLGGIPLSREVREQSDAGKPIVLSHPNSPSSQAFLHIAERIEKTLNVPM